MENTAKSRPGRPERLRGVITLLALAGILQSLGIVGMALLSRSVLDRGEGIAALLALAIGLPLLGAGCTLLEGRTMDRAAADLRRKLLARLLRTDSESCASYHSGQLMSRLTQDIYTVCNWEIGEKPAILGSLIRFAGALLALFYVAPLLASGATAAGLLVFLGGLALRPWLKRFHLEVRRRDEALTSATQEILEQLEFLRAIRANRESVRRFSIRQQEQIASRKRLRHVSTAVSSGFSLLTQLAYVLLLVWGGWSIRQGRLTFGDLAALMQLIGLFQGPLTSLSGIQARQAAVHAARERLEEIETLRAEPEKLPEAPKHPMRTLVFDHVTFCYEGEEHPVLRDFSARIPLNQWTCLTGVSGSGKSTLYRLILGLYLPLAGRITLETETGETLPVSAATRGVFGFVPQLPWLFSGTVRENLLLAKPDATDRELWTVLDRTRCGFLRELPTGLDTHLDEGGGGLSVGQRQRIAVARAILSGAQVLLLDEITSALDEKTGEELLLELRETCPGAIFATHDSRLPDLLGAEKMALL